MRETPRVCGKFVPESIGSLSGADDLAGIAALHGVGEMRSELPVADQDVVRPLQFQGAPNIDLAASAFARTDTSARIRRTRGEVQSIKGLVPAEQLSRLPAA